VRCPIVFFDLETGGLQLENPIIQLAAAAVSPAWEVLETFERKIQFEVSQCEPEALQGNCYKDSVDWAKDARPEGEVMRDFKGFLDKYRCVLQTSQRTGTSYKVAILGGYNIATFDMERLKAAFKRHSLFLPVQYNGILDVLHGVIWHFAGLEEGAPRAANLRLTSVATHVGISTEGAHDATSDVRMTRLIAQWLLTGGCPLGE
jgi:DNA polymerase III epsilon subunit-like protein